MTINITEDDFFYGIEQTLKQGRQALNEAETSCLYITDEGLRCVVGHMMGEQVYSIPNYLKDSNPPAYRLINDGVIKSEVPTNVIDAAQKIHDGAIPKRRIRDRISNTYMKAKYKKALLDFCNKWSV